MLQEEVYKHFIDGLSDYNEPYFVSGGVATAIYTNGSLGGDLDIVLKMSESRVGEFIRLFSPERYFVPPKEIIELELQRSERGRISVIAFKDSYNVDIYFPGNDELVAWGLARVNKVQLGRETIRLACPEYVVLQKLRYFMEGGNERHLKDVSLILKEAGAFLDLHQVLNWVKRLGLDRGWNKVQLA